MRIRYTTFSEAGKRRANQDVCRVVEMPERNRTLMIVCDGMGDHSMGDVAAETVCNAIIISDKWEAEEYGIITLQHHIEEVNEVMFARLRRLLDENVPLHEIPERMKALNDKPGWLTNFNYESFYYL